MATITPKDFELTMAGILVADVTVPVTSVRLLAELIRCSENGRVERPTQVGPQLQKHLGISAVNYRAAMNKLAKLNLIERKYGEIYLLFIKGSVPTSLLIKQK